VSPCYGIRWLMYDGSLEPVRCGASNRCDYCAMFAALEAAVVLRLDAQMRQPEVGITTTTRREDFPFDELRKAEALLWRALRKGNQIGRRGRRPKDEPDYEAFPDLQYCGFLEWTTGEGTRAGGVRRPHIHHLVKGIPGDHPLLKEIWIEGPAPKFEPVQTTKLEQRVSDLWRAITGDAYIVEVRRLRTPAGAIAYLALHHHKRSQSPPPGFRGRRLRPSKGYYELPISELRQLARRLTSQDRVRMAVKNAVAVELEGADKPDRYEADDLLVAALCEGLRDLAREPLELQIDIWGETDPEAEREELLRRTVAELEKIRNAHPPELVRVREQQDVDHSTGIVTRRATAVLGALEPKLKRLFVANRDRDFTEAMAA